VATHQTKTVTTDAGGDATVYTSRVNGVVRRIIIAGTLDGGADWTITGETTGLPVLVIANTNALDICPKVLAAGNPAGTVLAENGGDLHVVNERIKVVVAEGGNAQTGTITFVTDD
jgi:hypothetical protein